MWQRILVLFTILWLAGCTLFSKNEPAQVVTVNSDVPLTHQRHVVQKGETLYAIAWQYGIDYREIAKANRIPSPYRIYPGQKLVCPKIFLAQAPAPVAPIVKSQPVAVVPSKIKTQQASSWIWPAKGKVTKQPKGIDIAGNLGAPVHACAGGKIVYSGSGLRGYGKLVIIKHDDTYLSAYGHNSHLLVTEGDTVTQGQPIAKMGQTDAGFTSLHFEIRKNGQPINPLQLLPRIAV